MHPKNINKEVGYLSPHEKILEVGDENHMLFQNGGYVILWMTSQERIAKTIGQYNEP